MLLASDGLPGFVDEVLLRDEELAVPTPIVSTDRADYTPGATAKFTARGFVRGTTLRFEVRDDPQAPGDDLDADVYTPLLVTDGGLHDLDGEANGQVVISWNVPGWSDPDVPPDALNATLLLTVIGTGVDGQFGTGDDQRAAAVFTDSTPEVHIEQVTSTITEPSNGDANFVGYIEVMLSEAVSVGPGIILNYDISGSAIQGTDYYLSQVDLSTTDAVPPTNSLFIAQGERSGRIHVAALPDVEHEDDETVTLTLTADTDPFGVGIGYTVVSPYSATITIQDGQTHVAGIAVADTFGDDAYATHPVTYVNGDATFSIRLTSRPSGNVTVQVKRNTLVVATQYFTLGDWDVWQDVSVSPGTTPATYTLDLATSDDSAYRLLPNTTVTVDASSDTVKLKVAEGGTAEALTPTASVRKASDATEGGIEPGVFTVSLDVPAPAGGLQIDYHLVGPTYLGTEYNLIDDAGGSPRFVYIPEGEVSASILITAIDDQIADGAVSVNVVLDTGAGYQVDPGYGSAGLQVRDNDVAAIETALLTNLASLDTTHEQSVVVDDLLDLRIERFSELVDMADVTISVALKKQPGTDVILTLEDPIYLSSQSLTFNSTNYDDPQSVSLTLGRAPDTSLTLHVTTDSNGDGNYSALDIDLPFRQLATPIDVTTALTTSEDGSGLAFGVRLGSNPTGEVTLDLTTTNDMEGVVDTPTLTFNAMNWNEYQVVTVAGVDDGLEDGDERYDVTLTDLGNYGGLSKTLSLVNQDDETSEVVIDDTNESVFTATLIPIEGATTINENGDAIGQFQIALLAPAPTGGLTVGYVILEGTAKKGDIDLADFYERLGDRSPLSASHGLTVGAEPASIAFGDLDNDSDLDALLSLKNGAIRYFENVGLASGPYYEEKLGTDNPFSNYNLSNVGYASAVGDVDNDGDPDVVRINNSNTIDYLQNEGNLNFIQQTGVSNPFKDLVNCGDSPVFVDIDDDGRLELFVGRGTGEIDFYDVRGNDPYYETVLENPLSGVALEQKASPTFADWDADGDQDLFVGTASEILYFENLGTRQAPVYRERPGALNPFDGIVGYDPRPVLVDIDDNGLFDAFATDYENLANTSIRFFEAARVQEVVIPEGEWNITVDVRAVDDGIDELAEEEFDVALVSWLSQSHDVKTTQDFLQNGDQTPVTVKSPYSSGAGTIGLQTSSGSPSLLLPANLTLTFLGGSFPTEEKGKLRVVEDTWINDLFETQVLVELVDDRGIEDAASTTVVTTDGDLTVLLDDTEDIEFLALGTGTRLAMANGSVFQVSSPELLFESETAGVAVPGTLTSSFATTVPPLALNTKGTFVNPGYVAVVDNILSFALLDDDVAGLTRDVTDYTTSESGATQTIDIVLDTEPTDAVYVYVSTDGSEATLSSDFGVTFQSVVKLVFTPSDWDVFQTITVKGEDDQVDDGDTTYHIRTKLVSADYKYSDDIVDIAPFTDLDLQSSPADLIIDRPRILESTIPAGVQLTFTNGATIATSAEVTLNNHSSKSVSFTGATPVDTIDYGVTAVVNDGDQRAIILVTADYASNAVGLMIDPYSYVTAATLAAGMTLYFSNGAVASLDADVVLSSDTGVVTNVTLLEGTEITTSDTTFFFEDMTVTIPYRVLPLSGDGLIGLRIENEQVHSIAFAPQTELAFSNGAIAVLPTELTFGVGRTGDYNRDGNVDAADYVIFRHYFGTAVSPWTNGDGNGDGIVGIHDYLIWVLHFGDSSEDPDSSAIVTLAPWLIAATGLAYYEEQMTPDLVFTNVDDDEAGIAVVQTDPSRAIMEGKSNNFFSVKLESEPTTPVYITLQPEGMDDNIQLEGEFAGEPITLVFDSENWDVYQSIEVTAVDDSRLEYDHTSQIVFSVSSDDPAYSAVARPNNVVVYIEDDEVPAASIKTVAGAIEANAPGYFVIMLDTPAPRGVGDVGIVVSYTVGGTVDLDETGETDDVQPIAGSVRIAPGETTSPLIAFPIDDFKTELVPLVVDGSYDGSTIDLKINTDRLTADQIQDLLDLGSVTLDAGTRLSFSSNGAIARVTTDATLTISGTAGNPSVSTVEVSVELVSGDSIVAGETSFVPEESLVVTLVDGPDYRISPDGDTAILKVYDNDVPGIRIVEIGDSTTVIEDEGGVDFYVSLLSQPSDNVTIELSNIQTTRQLIVDQSYASGASTIRLKVDDPLIEALQLPAGDYDFGGTIATVSIASTLFSDRFTEVAVSLNGNISSGATADYSYEELAFGAGSQPHTLTFTPSDWFQLQAVSVSGLEDAVVETGDSHTSGIRYAVTSIDSNYDGLPVPTHVIDVIDRRFDVENAYQTIAQGMLALQDSLDYVELPLLGEFGAIAPPFFELFLEDLITEIRATENLTAQGLEDVFYRVINGALAGDPVNFQVVDILSSDVSFLLHFNDNFTTTFGIRGDLGLEALNIELSGSSCPLAVNYDATIGFGIDKTGGLYFETDQTTFEVTASPQLSAFSAKGELGFLQVNVVDHGSAMNAAFDVTLDAGADTQLTLPEIIVLRGEPQPYDYDFSDTTQQPVLDLNMVTSVAGNAAFPSFQFNLFSNLPLFDYGDESQAGATGFDLEFRDIKVDLGDLVTDLLGPMIGGIADVIEPIQPVINMLNSEIKLFETVGIAAEFDKNGDGAATLIEVADTLDRGLSAGRQKAKYAEFLDAVTGVIELADSLSDLESSIQAGGSLLIELGDYVLNNFKAASSTVDATTVNLEGSGDSSGLNREASQQATNSINNKVSKFFDKLDELNISIDVIEHPLNVVKLFFGQDIDLVTWDAPKLDLELDFDKSFPIFPGINGVLRGEFSAASDLFFGFDTYGLSQWKAHDFAREDAYLVFDGFYLSDVDPATGQDVDELTLVATISAGVEATIVVASVEATGGLQGTAGLDVIDVGEYSGQSDGKIRGSEILSRLGTPDQLFEVAGSLDAFLKIAAKVGFNIGFLKIEKTVYERELARITLFEFQIGGGGSGPASTTTFAAATAVDERQDAGRLALQPNAVDQSEVSALPPADLCVARDLTTTYVRADALGHVAGLYAALLPTASPARGALRVPRMALLAAYEELAYTDAITRRFLIEEPAATHELAGLSVLEAMWGDQTFPLSDRVSRSAHRLQRLTETEQTRDCYPDDLDASFELLEKDKDWCCRLTVNV